MTQRGEQQVLGTGKSLVGPGKLIDPSRLEHVFVSPRKRAQATFKLLFGSANQSLEQNGKVSHTEDIAEWGYGDYEGLLTHEIEESRSKRGLDKDKPWDIWRDGCEGGEYVHVYPRFSSKVAIPDETSDRLSR